MSKNRSFHQYRSSADLNGVADVHQDCSIYPKSGTTRASYPRSSALRLSCCSNVVYLFKNQPALSPVLKRRRKPASDFAVEVAGRHRRNLVPPSFHTIRNACLTGGQIYNRYPEMTAIVSVKVPANQNVNRYCQSDDNKRIALSLPFRQRHIETAALHRVDTSYLPPEDAASRFFLPKPVSRFPSSGKHRYQFIRRRNVHLRSFATLVDGAGQPQTLQHVLP